ncbi:hypothetical protein C6Y14_20245 [Streptomyces dioscori]|uniref:Uncharacterized protein n=1 Tax=Streptomyces dioscori TaxID=2109333 RepID=A0A2P8Q5T4_9ACTN|nr:hypothetical protein C6Y14_20245 [Streptomyces dioscori]
MHQVADVLIDKISQLGSNPNPNDIDPIADEVLKSTGSQVPTGDEVEVTVTGKEERVIVLTGLEVFVQTKKELTGHTMEFPMGCGAGVPPRLFDVNLDERKPNFTLRKSTDPEEKSIDFPYKVSSGEPEVLLLVSQSHEYVEWKARLLWVADGKEGHTDITNKGESFVTFPGGAWSDLPADYKFSPFDLKLTTGRDE